MMSKCTSLLLSCSLCSWLECLSGLLLAAWCSYRQRATTVFTLQLSLHSFHFTAFSPFQCHLKESPPENRKIEFGDSVWIAGNNARFSGNSKIYRSPHDVFQTMCGTLCGFVKWHEPFQSYRPASTLNFKVWRRENSIKRDAPKVMKTRVCRQLLSSTVPEVIAAVD